MNNMMGNMNMNMNMNPMGMNNQLMTNFVMDDTAMKIKTIIDPYEKKISELEQIIKQKDFEILVLKEKLNNFTNNQMMMNNQINMNNNMNMMNPMMAKNDNKSWMDNYNMQNNMNMDLLMPNQNIINELLPNMNITFRYKDKQHIEACNEKEKCKKVFRRVCKKFGLNYRRIKFIKQGKKVLSQLTIAESGISYNDNIFVVEIMGVKGAEDPHKNQFPDEEECDDESDCECDGHKHNYIFKTTKGKTTNVVISQEHSIGTLLKKYLIKVGQRDEIIKLREGKSDIIFIYNAYALKINDKRKLKDFFSSSSKIVVSYANDSIGV